MDQGQPIILTEIIRSIIKDSRELEPIFTNELFSQTQQQFRRLNPNAVLPDKRSFNTCLARIAKTDGNFKRYQKGIYYNAIKTSFGLATLSTTDVIQKQYIFDHDRRIGYETGPSLMQKVGLTTQIPIMIYVATNKVRNSRKDSVKKICLMKPVVAVTEKNFKYLQFLDMLENKFEIEVEVAQPDKIMQKAFRQFQLDEITLIKYATVYPADVLVKAANFIREMDDEFTFGK